MPNTNSAAAPANATNRAALFELHEAASDALVARGPAATIQVTLPDGTAGLAFAADLWMGEPGQTIRVAQGRRLELWWACQLALAPVT